MRSTSTVLAVAFSTMSVLACGSGTPTGNGASRRRFRGGDT